MKYQFLGLSFRQKCIHVFENNPKPDCASLEVSDRSLRRTVLEKMHFYGMLGQIHRVQTTKITKRPWPLSIIVKFWYKMDFRDSIWVSKRKLVVRCENLDIG